MMELMKICLEKKQQLDKEFYEKQNKQLENMSEFKKTKAMQILFRRIRL